nr:MAG TPA: hypothetical protein [Caudoviricetes sp.]
MHRPFMLIKFKVGKIFEFNAHVSNILRNFAISIMNNNI